MMEELVEGLTSAIDEKGQEAWQDFVTSPLIQAFLQQHPEFAAILKNAEATKQVYTAGFGVGYAQGLLDLIDTIQKVSR